MMAYGEQMPTPACPPQAHAVSYRIHSVTIDGETMDGVCDLGRQYVLLGKVLTNRVNGRAYVQPWYIPGVGLTPAPANWRDAVCERLG